MDGISASIVIPVYNSARFLTRCLDSVLAQTRGDFEVICVDNGSTDGSLELLEERAGQDPRVTVLREPRPGVSCARNAGIARARGDFLLFVDADDTVAPELVERAVGAAQKCDAQLVIYSFDECYEDPRAGFPAPPCPDAVRLEEAFATRDLELPAMLVVTPNVWRIAFRSSYVRDLGLDYPEELRTSEDLVYVYRALLPADRVVVLPDILYHYSRDNLASLTRRDRQDAGITALRMIYDALAGRRDEPWFSYQFVNLVLDTFEYQMRTCATLGEYLALFDGFLREWHGYVCARPELVDERYAAFFSLMREPDPLECLFAQQAGARRDAEFFRVWDQAHKQELTVEHERVRSLEGELAAERERAEAVEGSLRAELDAIYASRSWRLARTVAKIAHGGRG